MPITQNQDQLSDLLHLAYLPQIGNKRMEFLLSQFGNASNALQQNASAWQKLGMPAISFAAIGSSRIGQQVKATLQWAEDKNHHILQSSDAYYPERLKQLNDKPHLLFVNGSANLLNHQLQIAIVGARNATITGLDNAYNFAKQLARFNFVVTSGLALGIDGAAHQGSLAGLGKTIAVLGTGLPIIYPRSHQKLARQIVESGGALISEFALNTPPNKENFPKRNRIISALSLGVLIVEAGTRSGSLITARLANEQGREVWAIPGNLQNTMAKGCHELIRKGSATLVENIEHIFETLSDEFRTLKQEANQALNQAQNLTNNKEANQSPILQLLCANNFSAEQLSEHLNQPLSDVLAELSDLEISGKIQNNGGIYILRS